MTANNTPALRSGGKSKSAGNFRNTAMGKLVFAFDFGEFSVKVAVFKLKRNSIELRHLFSVENKENLTKLDNSNVRNWRIRLQRAFSQRNLSTDDHLAVCTVGGKSFIHRQLDIPYADEKDRNGLVENEMSQLLALDPMSYVFQHELLEVTGTGDNRRCSVWAVAMPQETCSAAYELMRSLKLRPLVMDIHACGIRRYLAADESIRKETEGQTVACIDYGMTHTEIIFVKDGKILGDTLVDVGDGRLVAEAKNAMGIRIADPSNANKLTASPEDICNIMNKAHTTAEEREFSSFVEGLLSRINTAISRFNFEHAAEPVKKIFTYGGSPQLIWLVQYIASVTRIPSEIINDASLFDTDALMNEKSVNYSAYLNVLNLGLMD